MKTTGAAIAAALVLSGCTAVTVKPVDPSAKIQHVCIKDNPKVIVEDFVSVVEAALERHMISSEIYEGRTAPAHCEYVMTYTARQSWDFNTYLTHAELHIERSGQPFASAIFHLKNNGGLSLAKWGSTKSKMDPVVDQLLGTK